LNDYFLSSAHHKISDQQHQHACRCISIICALQGSVDLGDVNMVASVIVNGKSVGNLLAPPYCIDLKDAVRSGQNSLEIKVTSTWFNRLVFDAAQPEERRKTWVISGPNSGSTLRSSGLMGPVKVQEYSTH
jgi:hypothetical protein